MQGLAVFIAADELTMDRNSAESSRCIKVLLAPAQILAVEKISFSKSEVFANRGLAGATAIADNDPVDQYLIALFNFKGDTCPALIKVLRLGAYSSLGISLLAVER